jgi:hypothetical protein
MLFEGHSSKNCEMYSESTFCIVRNLGSYLSEKNRQIQSLVYHSTCLWQYDCEWGTYSVMHDNCHNNSSKNAWNHNVCTCDWRESTVLTYKCLTTTSQESILKHSHNNVACWELLCFWTLPTILYHLLHHLHSHLKNPKNNVKYLGNR